MSPPIRLSILLVIKRWLARLSSATVVFTCRFILDLHQASAASSDSGEPLTNGYASTSRFDTSIGVSMASDASGYIKVYDAIVTWAAAESSDESSELSRHEPGFALRDAYELETRRR